MTTITRRTIWLFTLLAILVGAGLRLWHIGAEPLWLDEAYSAYAAAKGFDFLWQIVPRYETHPPFYYTLLRLWTFPFGDSLITLRAFGLLCGLATIGAIAMTARELARLTSLDRTSRTILIALAVVLAAVAPMLIEMSREVRPYPVLILVYTIAIAALFRLGKRIADGGRIGGASYRIYLVMLALTLWLHNLGALYAAALGLALIVLTAPRDWSKRDWIALIGGHLLVLVAWLPAVLILADQAPTWIGSTWLHFPPPDLLSRIMTMFGVPYTMAAMGGIVLIGLAIVGASRTSLCTRALIALLILALAPLIASLAISALLTPVFILRTLTPVGVPAALLFAFGASLAKGKSRWIAGAAFAIIVAQMISADLRLRRAGPPEDWYHVIRWIQARIKPGDIVLTYPNEGSLPFDRAVRDLRAGIPSHPIPVAVPAFNVGGWYPTGSRGVVSLPPSRLREIAKSPAISHAWTIWLIRMGPWAYDKGDIFLSELKRDRDHVDHHQSGVIVLDGLRQKELHE